MLTSDLYTLPLEVPAVHQRTLDATLEAYVRAQQIAMDAGRHLSTTSNALIHRHCYRRLRAECGLSANLAVKAIARAARRLKAAEQLPAVGLVDYDARTLSLADDVSGVSLSTVEGRLRWIRLVASTEDRLRLQGQTVVRACLRKHAGPSPSEVPDVASESVASVAFHLDLILRQARPAGTPENRLEGWPR